MRRPGSFIDAFQATLPWPLDPFQVEAIERLEAHQGVLVSAPTSSGKTVIADYAVFRGLETSARTIYTTPLKALSNQKYRDYQRLHGEGYVGLVTGENTINPGAPGVGSSFGSGWRCATSSTPCSTSRVASHVRRASGPRRRQRPTTGSPSCDAHRRMTSSPWSSVFGTANSCRRSTSSFRGAAAAKR